MFWSFFARTPAPRTPRPRRARLEVEDLQQRVLPSTSPLMLDARPALSNIARASASKAHQNLTFPLRGETAAKGRAQAKVVDGKLTKLAVHILRAPKGQTFSVVVNDSDRALGSIKTNSGGSGRLVLGKLSVPVENGSVLKVIDAEGNVLMQGRFRIRAPRR